MLSFCRRFGGTSERRQILGGLLELRRRLREHGIVDGFQWLDGSMVENVEELRGRAPADVDVVTFADLGDEEQQYAWARSNDPVFDGPETKGLFHVDHYMVSIREPLDERRASRIAYWYSMWSHQRDTHRWKGFVSVNLRSNDDLALEWLDSQENCDEVLQ
jgi:hypothetical protein